MLNDFYAYLPNKQRHQQGHSRRYPSTTTSTSSPVTSSPSISVTTEESVPSRTPTEQSATTDATLQVETPIQEGSIDVIDPSRTTEGVTVSDLSDPAGNNITIILIFVVIAILCFIIFGIGVYVYTKKKDGR